MKVYWFGSNLGNLAAAALGVQPISSEQMLIAVPNGIFFRGDVQKPKGKG